MLVSALLTSVGINTGLCFLFFTLYSVLRKQPSNYEVYIPRLVAEGKSRRRSRFNLERLIPSPGWVKKAWKLSEEELLSISGLDAVVFMRIIIFSLRVFAFAGVIGVFILLPINCTGDQLEDIDFVDFSNNSLDVFTISNVTNGSDRLWVHFCAVYVVTIFVCLLLYYEYNNVSSKRIAYFYASKPQPHQFTVLVRSVPVSVGSSVSDSVERFFREYHPSTYLCHVVVRRTNRLRNLINDTKKLYRRLIHMQADPTHQKYKRNSCFGLFGRKVDLVDHYEKKLEDLEENVRLEQSEVSLAGEGHPRSRKITSIKLKLHHYSHYGCHPSISKVKNLFAFFRGNRHPGNSHFVIRDGTTNAIAMATDFLRREVRAAFVSFNSRYAAATAFHVQQGINPTQWLTEAAPEPHDVYWPFFSSSFMRRWISKLVVIVACILLTILFLIPVLVVQGLTNLSQLEVLFPFLKSILTITFVSEVITGYLPSLILQLFLKVVPPIMEFLSSIQGYNSHSAIERSACNKVLWFTIWNIFFATVFSGSVLYQLSIVLDPKNIPAKLGVSVPAQASFFIAYVVTSGWTSTSSELFRIIPFIWSLVKRPFVRDTDEEFEVPSIPYHRDIPRILFFGLLGITYFFLAPLILPFLLIYLCLAYIIYRNQFLIVYAPRYETAGKFWPIVHNSMIFSLVLMHCIAVGIFTVKKLPLASTLIFPLPVLTLLFNEYCRKRFLPIFVAYSAESLIKKDREDQNDPSMLEFLDKLVTAYQDPALLPIQYSAHSDGLSSPLISSAEA